MYFLLLILLLLQFSAEVLVFQLVLIMKPLFPFLLLFQNENCIQAVVKILNYQLIFYSKSYVHKASKQIISSVYNKVFSIWLII